MTVELLLLSICLMQVGYQGVLKHALKVPGRFSIAFLMQLWEGVVGGCYLRVHMLTNETFIVLKN